jgi:hypothetical protein
VLLGGNRLVFTVQAEQMLLERQIDREWLEQTIAEPEVLEHDPSKPNVLRAFRRIPQRGHRMLRVAYIPAEASIRVITVFFDRGRR